MRYDPPPPGEGESSVLRAFVNSNSNGMCVRILAAQCARGLHRLRPLLEKRAQGKPGARCTRGLVCKSAQRKRTRAYRFSGGIPAFPAQWFTTYFVLSPVTALSCHRHPRDTSRELSACIEAPGPHDYAVRISLRSSSLTIRDHSIQPLVLVARSAPLS